MGKLGKPQKSKKHKKMKVTFDSKPDGAALPIGGKRTKLHNLPVNDEDLDRQEIPRKLKDIMKSTTDLKTAGKQQKKNNKKKKFKKAVGATFKMERGMSKPMTPIPRFVQGKHEKDRNFIRRIELEAHRVVMNAQMEEKYQMEIPENGKNIASARVQTKTSEKKKERNKERKQKKKQAMKEKKLDKAGDFSVLKDEVAFGEVAMAPPSLTAKPRKVQVDTEKSRPGQRSLLLKEMMDTSEKSDKNTSNEQVDHTGRMKPKSQARRQAGQTVKRKFLSPVQKQITDFQRQKAIDQYRKMKEHKIKQPR